MRGSMNKKLLFLTISLLSLRAFAAEPTEALNTSERLRQEHVQLYTKPELSLQEQIDLAREGIEDLTAKIEGLTGEDKYMYFCLLSRNPEDTEKKVIRIFIKLLTTEKVRLQALHSQAEAAPSPDHKDKSKITLTAQQIRKSKATELRAATAEDISPMTLLAPTPVTYDAKLMDKDTLSESIYAAILQYKDSLRMITKQNPIIVDGGLCLHCGFITTEKEFHKFYPITPTEENQGQKIKVKITDSRLDKNPSKWLKTVRSSTNFTEKQKERAETIVTYFSLLSRAAKKNLSLLAETLVELSRYDWICTKEAQTAENLALFCPAIVQAALETKKLYPK